MGKKFVAVEFIKRFQAYNVGDRASFDSDMAGALIKGDVAIPYKMPPRKKPQPQGAQCQPEGSAGTQF